MNQIPGALLLEADIWRMKKHRRLLKVLGVVALALGLLAGIGLLLASRPTTSYGTATDQRHYAPAVREMVSAQRELAGALQARFEGQSEAYSQVQQNFDHQSAQANSLLGQWLGSPSCPVGQVRYTDVLNVSVDVADGAVPDVASLLEELSADGVLAGGKLTGTSIAYADSGFRIDVTSVTAGNRATLRLTVPNLPDRADRAAYACYPAAQVPLSSVRQLG